MDIAKTITDEKWKIGLIFKRFIYFDYYKIRILIDGKNKFEKNHYEVRILKQLLYIKVIQSK